MNERRMWEFIIGGGILVMLLLAVGGCRSRSRQEFEFRSGDVARAVYEQASGWSFWSEGQGKTIEISPTVNGVQF